MPTMVERWLTLAHTLLNDYPRSTGMRRRAVSTAYYSVFHAIARLCADELASEHDRASPEYQLVYRNLDHAGIRKALTGGPLAKQAKLRRIGEAFMLLQEERAKADYMPSMSNIIEPSRARELLAEAEFVVGELATLDPALRQMLIIHLLLKERQRS